MTLRLSLSGMDAAFLSLETPNTPMNVMGTFVLDPASGGGGYSCEQVVQLIEERLVGLAPFRRRLVAVPFGLDHPVWIDDPDFRVRDHVHRVTAPAPGSERVLAALVARIAALPLDRTRPLWELWVVEGLTEGRVALVFKLHHALADGVSASQAPAPALRFLAARAGCRRIPDRGRSRSRLRRSGRCWPTRSRGCPSGPRASRGCCATARDPSSRE